MAERFIFINTYTIDPERVAEYEERFRRTAELVEAEEPRMLYFACHISEDGTRASTVQVHADAENMANHLRIAADHIEAAGDVLDFSTMSILIFGTPTAPILDRIEQLTGAGVTVRVAPASVAFDRFPEV